MGACHSVIISVIHLNGLISFRPHVPAFDRAVDGTTDGN